MTAVPAFSPRILACLKAPGGSDAETLELDNEALICTRTGTRYPFANDIPSLMPAGLDAPAGVGEQVKTFYETHPFPGYEGVEEFSQLVSKGLQNHFTRALLDAIGYNKTVLECGCGTGQLSHFLQLNNNHVLGIDFSMPSLMLAVEHKQRNQLVRSGFCQMDIFDLALRDSSFDVVISHGVLHHTRDARRAFAQVVRKAKPGGLVMIGLYNWYARVPTWVRGRLMGLLGPRIDYVVRTRIRDARKAQIWVADQYHNPHETWHSIDDALSWFDENNVEYLNCYPPILGTDGETATNLASPTTVGTRWQRLITQLGWVGTIAREGALFDLIGRRR